MKPKIAWPNIHASTITKNIQKMGLGSILNIPQEEDQGLLSGQDHRNEILLSSHEYGNEFWKNRRIPGLINQLYKFDLETELFAMRKRPSAVDERAKFLETLLLPKWWCTRYRDTGCTDVENCVQEGHNRHDDRNVTCFGTTQEDKHVCGSLNQVLVSKESWSVSSVDDSEAKLLTDMTQTEADITRKSGSTSLDKTLVVGSDSEMSAPKISAQTRERVQIAERVSPVSRSFSSSQSGWVYVNFDSTVRVWQASGMVNQHTQ